jgi:hypothetical protein
MPAFHIHSRTIWSDFNASEYRSSQLYTSRQTSSSSSVHISNCLFRSITAGSDGGAFYSTSVLNLFVESTSFFSCKTSTYYGGAIYFSNSNGQCVLHEVCGYDCCSTYPSSGSCYTFGQFIYAVVNDAASSKNYVSYSSVVRCVNDRSYSYYTLWLVNGNIFCPSVNFSMNKGHYQLIHYNPTCDSSSVTTSFSYSSFADNIVTGYTYLLLWKKGANFEIKSCNILRNIQGVVGSQGTIYTCGNLMIENSCILENTATYSFLQGNSNCRITLSNCTADKTASNGYLTITNTVTNGFILALNHMSTEKCHAEYDVCGTLTRIAPRPPFTKKQTRCFTCRNPFNHPRLIDSDYLIFVLIFNFIHIDAFINLWY